MEAKVRLAIWVGLYVLLLLGLPAVLPPTQTPSYTAPLLSPGETWTYQLAPVYQGTGRATEAVGATVASTSQAGPSGATALLEFHGAGAEEGAWPFVSWQVTQAAEAWTSFSFNCSAGRSWVNLSSPLPVGLSFPVMLAGAYNASVSASFSGACLAASEGTVASSGGTTVIAPAGAIDHCTLFVCNEARTYATRATLTVLPSGGGGPLQAWTLRGLWDPNVAVYRDLSVAPGTPPGFSAGSANLTLVGSTLPGIAPAPSPVYGYGESALLIALFPILALGWEIRRLRRVSERLEKEQDRKVLAAIEPAEGGPKATGGAGVAPGNELGVADEEEDDEGWTSYDPKPGDELTERADNPPRVERNP